MPSVVAIQHVAAEGLGRFEPLLRQQNIDIVMARPDAVLDRRLIDTASGIIILGGPMSVYEAERYPRLRTEMRLIEDALKRQLPLLGLCLGSQLLAEVLGSRVRPGPAKELGWHDVILEESARDDLLFQNMPARFKALHWHGDIFPLPGNARHLARSAMTECQAFSYGSSAWGLLFHVEAGLPEVQAMAAAFPDELSDGATTTEELIKDTMREEAGTALAAGTLFSQWAKILQGADNGGGRE
jgi:GMP synthase (glutamine-hydrolysing)